MKINVAKAAKDHFKAKLSENLKIIEVPEWTDENGAAIKIYYRSALRLSQRSIILKYTAKDEFDKALAYGFAYRARDEEGKRLFQDNQIDQIIDEIDPTIVERLCQLFNQDEYSIEEIEKN